MKQPFYVYRGAHMPMTDFRELLAIVNDSRSWFGSPMFPQKAVPSNDLSQSHWHVDLSSTTRNPNDLLHPEMDSFLEKGLSVTWMEKNDAGQYVRTPMTLFHKSNWTKIPDEAYRSGQPSLAAYRVQVVNHELGHVLGSGHRRCGAPGDLAPVMLQQTKGTRQCKPNPWPLAYEIQNTKEKSLF